MPTDFRDGKTFPRRGREPLGGFLWLARVFDKARATLLGMQHDYIYPCPMDKGAMSAWGIEPHAFTTALATHSSDEHILRWVQERVPAERMRAGNQWILEHSSSLDRQDEEEGVTGQPVVDSQGARRDTSDLRPLIRAVPDFPQPGILFRDITPMLRDSSGFASAVDMLAGAFSGERLDYVVAIEARGYVIGAPLAYKLGTGLIPVRKPGKLPYATIKADYTLEYGTNSLEVHSDALSQGHRVIIVDDLLATGGTAAATKTLIERLGGDVVGAGFIIELAALGGRARLGSTPVKTLLTY